MNLETARGQVAYDLTMEYVKETNMFNTTSRTVEETVNGLMKYILRFTQY